MYLLIAGDKNDSLDWSVICLQTEEYLEDLNEENYTHLDFCYAVDGDTGKVAKNYKVPTWENRHNATAEEAIKIITSRLNCLDYRNPDKGQLEMIEMYAKEKGVPFSAAVHTQFMSDFCNENPQWDSSSAYC